MYGYDTISKWKKHIQSTNNLFQGKTNTQLTLEQHSCELHGFTSMWIFFNKYIEKFLGGLGQFEKNKPHRWTVYPRNRKKFKKKVCHKCMKYIYTKYVFLLLVRLLVSSRLQKLSLVGIKSYRQIFSCVRVDGVTWLSALNSTVFKVLLYTYMLLNKILWSDFLKLYQN